MPAFVSGTVLRLRFTAPVDPDELTLEFGFQGRPRKVWTYNGTGRIERSGEGDYYADVIPDRRRRSGTFEHEWYVRDVPDRRRELRAGGAALLCRAL